MKRWLVFTDLDQTLLNADTYSFEDALEAIEFLKRHKIPLIFCTSKTRAECQFYQKAMMINEPFIVENGGGIYIPENYFSNIPYETLKRNGYLLIKLGTDYAQIRRVFEKIKSQLQNSIIGFAEMSIKEIVRECNLPPRMAELARMREFDEPFKITQDHENILRIMAELANKEGLVIIKGSRFHHLQGNTNKGKATGQLIMLYRSNFGEVSSIGVGDSPNDLPMLLKVDLPVVIKKPDGEYSKELEINLRHAYFAPEPGPMGWAKAILTVIKNGRSHE